MEPYLERKREWKQGARQVDIRKQVYGDPFFKYDLYSDAYDRWHEEFTKYFKNRPNDFLILDIIMSIVNHFWVEAALLYM